MKRENKRKEQTSRKAPVAAEAFPRIMILKKEGDSGKNNMSKNMRIMAIVNKSRAAILSDMHIMRKYFDFSCFSIKFNPVL